MKRRYKLVCLFIMALFLTTTVSAETSEIIGISFEGNAEKFILFQGDTNNSSFTNIEPGEERTQRFVVRNDSYEKMKFYVRADQTEMLNSDGSSQRIVYDIDFKNDGTSFFSGRVGTKANVGKENLKENYLLKTLSRGESTTIDMTIKIDGTSMDNSYQGSVGNLGLVFNVEVDTGNPVVEVIKKIPVINKIPGVVTGDQTVLIGLFGSVILSGFFVVFLLKKKKKGDTDEKA